MFLIDNDGRVIGTNETMAQRCASFAGFPHGAGDRNGRDTGKENHGGVLRAEDLSALTIDTLYSAGMITQKLAEGERVARAGKRVHFVENVMDRWYENTLYPIPGRNGSVASVAVYIHDITTMKETETKLSELNTQLQKERDDLFHYRSMLDNMDDAVIIATTAGDIQYVNAAFRKRFGYTDAEIGGRHMSDLQAPGNQFALSKQNFVEDQKAVWTGTMIAKNKVGVKFRVSLKSTPVAEENHTTHRVFVLRDQF
jgi:PAS domain S-box-containing protein